MRRLKLKSGQKRAKSPALVSAQQSSEFTPRQAAFIDHYVDCKIGVRAAILAGYAAGSADVTAARLLGNARIRAAIDAKLAQRAEKLEISGERVIRELALLGFSNMGDYMRPGK